MKPERLPQRRSIRLAGYDYTAPGAYFITICSANRACLFGEIVDGQMQASPLGEIAVREWQRLEKRFPSGKFDAFVVMPNHVHAILVIMENSAQTNPAGKREGFSRPVVGSIPTIVRSYKSAVTLRVNARCDLPGEPVWQRNYWEHIVRDEADWSRIREYSSITPSTGTKTSSPNFLMAKRSIPFQR